MSTFEAPLAGEVRAAELRHGVVAELEEDPLVEVLGPLGTDLGAAPSALAALRRELVQEQAPQRPGVARIAREQRALHDLGQVHDAEDRAVEVREVRLEQPLLVGCELFVRVVHRGQRCYSPPVGPVARLLRRPVG